MPKRADVPYVSACTETWLKLKCQPQQKFIVRCFTDRTNVPRDVGSLPLGS